MKAHDSQMPTRAVWRVGAASDVCPARVLELWRVYLPFYFLPLGGGAQQGSGQRRTEKEREAGPVGQGEREREKGRCGLVSSPFILRPLTSSGSAGNNGGR